MSKLLEFIEKAKKGQASSADPFDENFFDAEKWKQRRDDEDEIVERALEMAREKAARFREPEIKRN